MSELAASGERLVVRFKKLVVVLKIKIVRLKSLRRN